MSGDDDPSNAKPSKNPFFDEIDAPPPARARRAKPAPGIISGAGLDMARGHASGIAIRETGPAQKVDEPRVVLAVETDLRKVPTDKRLLEGRDANADGSRSAMLPGTPGATPMPSAAAGGWMPAAAAAPPTAAAAEVTLVGAPIPAIRPADRKLPVWMRVAMVAVLLLLVAGVLKRTGVFLSDEPAARALTTAPPAPTFTAAPPAPLPPPPPVGPAAATETATAAPPVQKAVAPVEPPKPPPPAAEPVATAHTAKPVQAPGPPKPTFKPPFELPSEKN